MGHDAGTPIALTAPLTESIDHAGARAHLFRRHRDDDRLRPALCVLSAGPEPTDLCPEAPIMEAVRANVAAGNRQISRSATRRPAVPRSRG
jgi:hypothetical protein